MVCGWPVAGSRLTRGQTPVQLTLVCGIVCGDGRRWITPTLGSLAPAYARFQAPAWKPGRSPSRGSQALSLR
jgi:hypothetical protein